MVTRAAADHPHRSCMRTYTNYIISMCDGVRQERKWTFHALSLQYIYNTTGRDYLDVQLSGSYKFTIANLQKYIYYQKCLSVPKVKLLPDVSLVVSRFRLGFSTLAYNSGPLTTNISIFVNCWSDRKIHSMLKTITWSCNSNENRHWVDLSIKSSKKYCIFNDTL